MIVISKVSDLHSTMYLLNYENYANIDVFTTFTFHYVSIK